MNFFNPINELHRRRGGASDNHRLIFSRWIGISILLCLSSGCIKFPKAPITPNPGLTPSEVYVYPFSDESAQVTAEVVITLASGVDISNVQVEIPPLKYNKTLLVLLSQDDCKHAAYSTTWAAINGRPLSDTYYYNASQLQADDLPPDIYTLGKTLGSTDGAGREVCFSFLTTLAPEWVFMSDKVNVKPGFTANYYRFFMKSGLIWENVAEMVNYGVGIAFHDVNSDQVDNSNVIVEHYKIAQDSIMKHLAGRGCKLLAEPNGNKTYVAAAAMYDLFRVSCCNLKV